MQSQAEKALRAASVCGLKPPHSQSARRRARHAAAQTLMTWLLACVSLAACARDVVEPGYYADPGASIKPVMNQNDVATGGSMLNDGRADGSTKAPNFSLDGSVDWTQAFGDAALAVDGGAPPGPCDLSGAWLVTYHDVADGLGQLQTVHSWLYYEIEQHGDNLLVTKGLHCGEEVVARTLLGVNVDMQSSWDAVTQKVFDTGRTGTSRKTAQGCEIMLNKMYMVEGATVPHYLDPSTAMPGPSDQASNSTPGWEDWDGDGNPGITLNVTGAAAGSLYVAVRAWHQASGTLADIKDSLQLTDSWDQETSVLGYSGSSLLTQQGVRATDPTLHFVELARLDPAMFATDHLSICSTIRSLAPTLTPTANGL